FLGDARAPNGHLAGPPLTHAQRNDVEVGMEVARRLGELDIGQTVVGKSGHVLALEAVEGTDETIPRAARVGGPGAVVVKVCKPGQDERFDLPTVGTTTLAVMGDFQATVLAVEAHRTLLLDAPRLFAEANRRGISVVGCEVPASHSALPPQRGAIGEKALASPRR